MMMRRLSVKCSKFIWHAALILSLASQVSLADAAEQTDQISSNLEPSNHPELAWELDAYYTDIGLNIPLTEKPIPTIRSNKELVILEQLIKDSFMPRFMLLEASVYPMPVLGTFLKEKQSDFYQKGQLANSNLNVIESVTAGFQEPWAVSVFFGNIAKLVRPGEARNGSNVGYTGYLISGGKQHIKHNVLIADNWLEFEWKIKGKLDYPDEKLGWSFRVGSKFHDNPGITDVYYVSLARSTLNAQWPILAWLNNNSFNLKTHFSQNDFQIVRQEFIVGEKMPSWTWQHFVPNMEIGLIWTSPNEYRDTLRDATTNNTLTFVLRPSIEF